MISPTEQFLYTDHTDKTDHTESSKGLSLKGFSVPSVYQIFLGEPTLRSKRHA